MLLGKRHLFDYDISQCCMPCFEGLFSAPHDSTVQDLLYVLTYWSTLR